jgi:resuscitation-promoting factor RpfB
MRRAIGAALVVGGLFVLGACGSGGETPTAAVTTKASVTASPSVTPSTASGSPVVKKRTMTERRAIPFTTRRVHDPTVAKGTTKIRTRGVAGVKILTYEVTFTNGVRTGKKLISNVVVKAPITQVIVIGTKEAPQCDPNYSGACVPIASDVDCAGGSGNGPAYVQGPVRVIGTDIYGLDRDGDGIGCES